MEDLKRAKCMERVLRDMRGEGKSLATLSKRYNLSEESIRNALGIRHEEEEAIFQPIRVGFWKKLGF